MSRRELKNRHIRSLLKLGGGSSYGISLPKEFIQELGWRSKQKLVVKRYGSGLIIRDWEPKKG
ncbi:MAG: AbrB/MazE/SpoVT family DNA-binding domain-containing protein [Bacteroidetes bacterium]|nr:AbrB/MazE/SpoVT family DNA-binding domain-containing protein [Bacteroidota bacterium]